MSRIPFWLRILAALFLGIAAGLCFHAETGIVNAKLASEITVWFKLPGDLFLNLLQMIMGPLVVASVALGVSSLSSLSELYTIGLRTMLYFITTTTIAILIGIFFVTWIEPGKWITDASKNSISITNQIPVSNQKMESIPQMVSETIPKNIIRAFLENRMLSLVILGIFLGLFLLTSQTSDSHTWKVFLRAIESFSLWTIGLAMAIAPFAVFGLITFSIAHIGLQLIAALSAYVLTVMIGLVTVLVFYMIILKSFTKVSILNFLKSIREVQILGFSTSSSSSVLPVSLKIAKQTLNVKEKVADFVLPLGATINMDGTALYQAVAAVFIAQVFQIELSTSQIFFLVITVVGASIGTAATPGVGIVILGSILESFQIPIEGIALIFGVDRILDMCRTAINLSGDLVATVVIDSYTDKK
ncbi:proton glutamate symport protein [Leptospira ryugenii]|uniref:Proton glutamate symport protein n=1 Tax=Leptospira ryugenii TaxID=1917863 RepID=A0A2P2E3A2_9LEPT|nr:dicarboxylate/amino acid:cation symporter [Leptospira ryugenii]GBF51372.1 proton glutamate symport protein [Leptospira ryugenii]